LKHFTYLPSGADSYDQQIYLPDHSTLNHRARSNSYNSPAAQSELGPLARIPSPDPDHIDGLHRHGSHSSAHGTTSTPPPDTAPPSLPPLSFDFSSPLTTTFNTTKELPSAPPTAPSNPTHSENRTSAIFQHPNFNSSAPALSTMGSAGSNHPQPPLAHRSATAPIKRLTFATNLSVYDTFSASVYDRRSEPATWSRLTPALAQRIKEELNSYKMEEMEVHAASRIQYVFSLISRLHCRLTSVKAPSSSFDPTENKQHTTGHNGPMNIYLTTFHVNLMISRPIISPFLF